MKKGMKALKRVAAVGLRGIRNVITEHRRTGTGRQNGGGRRRCRHSRFANTESRHDAIYHKSSYGIYQEKQAG